MTNVGHSLTGLSLGVVCMPRRWSRWAKAGLLLCFAVLANIPDVRLPGWGHDRYDISHSLPVNLGLVMLAALIAGLPAIRKRIGGWPVIACGGAAWMSHLLLDSLYSHGRGIAILWPISKARLALPLPWFDTLEGGWAADLHSLRVGAIEALFFGSLLAICILARRYVTREVVRTGP